MHNLDDRHIIAAKRITDQHHSLIKAAGKINAKAALYDAVIDAIRYGVGYGLGAEENAWQRVLELEDTLIMIAKHAPDGEIVKSRSLCSGK